MKDNRGAQLMRKLDLSQSAVAEALETHQSVVCRWLSGQQRPNATMRARIEKVFGIDWRAFDAPPTKKGNAA